MRKAEKKIPPTMPISGTDNFVEQAALRFESWLSGTKSIGRDLSSRRMLGKLSRPCGCLGAMCVLQWGDLIRKADPSLEEQRAIAASCNAQEWHPKGEGNTTSGLSNIHVRKCYNARASELVVLAGLSVTWGLQSLQC